MAEFFNVLPPDDARALLLRHVRPILDVERLATIESMGRVTAAEARAPHALPSFRRSTMDGFAVRAADTYGAGDTLPAFLNIIGEIKMGSAAIVTLGLGEAVLVHTGGMLPDTADAVVQVEHTQPVGNRDQIRFPYEIEVYRPVAVGQNVIQIGEDVQQNSAILPAGAFLRPQDIGGLLAVGITYIDVVRRPRIAIIATGDEVIDPYSMPQPGQIRDINSYTVSCQCLKAGGEPAVFGIIPDDFDALHTAASAALENCDMLVMSAGSSVSVRDMTVNVIDSLGEPGVLLHGVATRPGKPTIVGAVGGKPVLGLPGNPVSAMIQFAMFGVPAIFRLQGLKDSPPTSRLWAKVTMNIASESGREDYVPAKIEATAEGFSVTPIFGKSNLIYTLVHADGLIKIPLNSGGVVPGELVQVDLF